MSKFNEWSPQRGYLPALSIRQPWAWLIVNGYKDIENRDWKTTYRGQILIHAGKQVDVNALPRPYGNHQFYLNNPHWHDVVYKMPKAEQDYETGGIVGIATLVDCVTSSKSPWFIGRYGFVLQDARPLPFLPYRGKLGLFAAPDPAFDGETVERANIPYIPSKDFDHAYELTRAIAKAEAAKQPHEVPVFGDPAWIERTRQKPIQGRCVIEVNGKQV